MPEEHVIRTSEGSAIRPPRPMTPEEIEQGIAQLLGPVYDAEKQEALSDD